MIGLHGAFAAEVYAYARERQRELAAETERERLARQDRATSTPQKSFGWLTLFNTGRSEKVVQCYPALQPACCQIGA